MRLVQIVWRDHLGHLGDFTSNPDGGFTGDIDALVIMIRMAPIRPVSDKSGDKRPGFRITCGKADLKWPGPRRKDKQVYPSVRIDAPSFGQAINAALVEIDGVLAPAWPRSGGPLEDRRARPLRRCGGAGAARERVVRGRLGLAPTQARARS